MTRSAGRGRGLPCAEVNSEKCSQQLAGVCEKTTSRRCDFSNNKNKDNFATNTVCPGTEQCTLGRGLLKYGDYNFLGIGDGLLVAICASGIPQTGGLPQTPGPTR